MIELNDILKKKCLKAFLKWAEEIDKRRLIYGPDQDRKWAINAYNCLQFFNGSTY